VRHSLPIAAHLVTAALAGACTHSSTPRPSLPPPCFAIDTVYAPSDTDTQFKPPIALQVYLPPSDFHGTALVHLLVNSRGYVLFDSVRVDGVEGLDLASWKHAFAAYRFWPATLGACAVSSWYVVTVRRD
jgi:hypothetical protein